MVLALLLGGCAAGVPQGTTTPSARPANELAVMQSRMMAANPALAMRATVAALHDLGYRFTQVDPRGAVSAIKENRLLVSVMVVAAGPGEVALRADARIRGALGPSFTQIDLPEFYERNLFAPIAAMAGAAVRPIAAGDPLPPAYPAVERQPSPLP